MCRCHILFGRDLANRPIFAAKFWDSRASAHEEHRPHPCNSSFILLVRDEEAEAFEGIYQSCETAMHNSADKVDRMAPHHNRYVYSARVDSSSPIFHRAVE